MSATGACERRRLARRPAGLLIAGAAFVRLQAFGAGAMADELAVPEAVERSGTVEAAYHFDQPATGRGSLAIEWSDADGRIVERRHIPLDLTAASEVGFALDMRRAVAMENRLAAHLSLDGTGDGGGPPTHREAAAEASFIAAPSDHPWSDYQIIMWQPQTAAGYRALKTLGVTAGEMHGDHSDEPSLRLTGEFGPLLASDTRFYVENIATDLYSSYHRWWGDRPVNWRFAEAKRRYWQNPRDETVFFRDPSLSNRQFVAKIARRMERHARQLHRYRPLYYCLGDEPGIADLAAFWDFDLSPASLDGMRTWLKGRYGAIAALNREWGTGFADWDAVVPMPTAAALKRDDGNYAGWADFKEWMDVAFARAVKAGTDGVHAGDPDAVAAIEGGQIPGWGGYDYARLAGVVDLMELYDFGDNVEIVRSFNPQMILLNTSGGSGPAEEHRIWRELLRGVRGLILWDEKREFVDGNGNIGPRGRAAAPYFVAIRDGIGGLLVNSARHIDRIGILYSQASMRVDWLLDRKESGEDWTRRSAGDEYQDNAIRRATRNFVGAIEHTGLQPRFVSAAQLDMGALRGGAYRVLILPRAIALSAKGGEELREFVKNGGIVIADDQPGIFDEHGRRLEKPPLADLFAAAAAAPGAERAVLLSSPGAADRPSAERLARLLAAAGIEARFPLAHPDGSPVRDVETYSFDDGPVTVLALLRDLPEGGAPPSGRESVVVSLPHAQNIYDLLTHRALPATDRLTLDLDPVVPTMLALSDTPAAPPDLSAPASARLGGNAEIRVRLHSGAARDVVRVEVVDPAGELAPHYSGNHLVAGDAAAELLPLAVNDMPGTWTIRATDPLSGTATTTLKVEP